MMYASACPAPCAWPMPSLRLPGGLAVRLALALLAFSVAMCGEPEPVPAAPQACPRILDGPTVNLPEGCPAPAPGVLYRPEVHAAAEQVRIEHAAMDAAGNLCLDALDATRAERTRCYDLASTRLDGVADLLRSQAAGFDAVARQLAEPAAAPRQHWALVGVGGLVAGGAGVAAAAADASVIETTGAVIGAAAVAAAITAVVQWAVGD